MTREYIMQVTVDPDGHEHGLTRVQELVRCGECRHRYALNSRCHSKPKNHYCGYGERKQ